MVKTFVLDYVPACPSEDFDWDAYSAFHAYSADISTDGGQRVWCQVWSDFLERFYQNLEWLRGDGDQVEVVEVR